MPARDIFVTVPPLSNLKAFMQFVKSLDREYRRFVSSADNPLVGMSRRIERPELYRELNFTTRGCTERILQWLKSSQDKKIVLLSVQAFREISLHFRGEHQTDFVGLELAGKIVLLTHDYERFCSLKGFSPYEIPLGRSISNRIEAAMQTTESTAEQLRSVFENLREIAEAQILRLEKEISLSEYRMPVRLLLKRRRVIAISFLKKPMEDCSVKYWLLGGQTRELRYSSQLIPGAQLLSLDSYNFEGAYALILIQSDSVISNKLQLANITLTQRSHAIKFEPALETLPRVPLGQSFPPSPDERSAKEESLANSRGSNRTADYGESALEREGERSWEDLMKAHPRARISQELRDSILRMSHDGATADEIRKAL